MYDLSRAFTEVQHVELLFCVEPMKHMMNLKDTNRFHEPYNLTQNP